MCVCVCVCSSLYVCVGLGIRSVSSRVGMIDNQTRLPSDISWVLPPFMIPPSPPQSSSFHLFLFVYQLVSKTSLCWGLIPKQHGGVLRCVHVCVTRLTYLSMLACKSSGLLTCLHGLLLMQQQSAQSPFRLAVQQRRAPPGTSARTGVCRLFTDTIIDVNLAAPLQYQLIRLCLVPIKEGTEEILSQHVALVGRRKSTMDMQIFRFTYRCHHHMR